MRRYLGVYLVLVAVPVGAAGLTVARLASGASGGVRHLPPDATGAVVSRLLLATSVVVALAALGGALACRVGQPRVVGELLAGLVLGPSALGALTPAGQHWLFPPQVLPYVDALAQFGVVFFMFLVGVEVAPGALVRAGPRALVIGHASIALPFLAGVLTAWLLQEDYRPDGAGTLAFLLFVGLSFAITAFPVLARILDEQRLMRTPLGTCGLTAAGLGDITAWCLLAVVVALTARSSPVGALLTVGLVVVFALVMLSVVRPLVAFAVARAERTATSRVALYAGLVCVVLAAALTTERIGVHAIFGAFLAGVVMPRESWLIAELTSKIEGVTLWFMLPLFFASVGLRVQLDAVSAGQWLICLLIVAVAVVTKVAGTGLAAAATGGGARESLALGVMMNCRGLTELVVLNLGLQLGVLSPALFVMFVVMALLTTVMTGPALRRVVRDSPLAPPAPEPAAPLEREPEPDQRRQVSPEWIATAR